MRVFFFAGEASGDAYAAALVRELRKLGGDWEFEGVGGKVLAAEGVNLIADSTSWGAMGILDGLRVAPRVTRGANIASAAMASGKPGIFVPIDFGFANIRVARRAKDLGWKVLYFIPPGCWRKDRQGKDLPQITDEIVTPFPWSAEMLNQMGARAHFFGHPLKDMLSTSPCDRGNGIALLPGSRRNEIKHNLGAMAGAVRGLPAAEFAVAPTVPLDELKRQWKGLCPDRNDIFTVGDVDGVLRRSRAAIVCSGTATLQAAITGTPMVVIYRLGTANLVQGMILKSLKDFEFISLPNILLGRPAVPELIQRGATPENIRSHITALLADSPERTEQLTALHEVSELLGESGCISKTAALIQEMANRP